MTKRQTRKANTKVGKVSKQELMSAKQLVEDGEMFGDSIIATMVLFAHFDESMGIAAIGLAKALAALKTVARKGGIDVEKLFDDELAIFERDLATIDFGGLRGE